MILSRLGCWNFDHPQTRVASHFPFALTKRWLNNLSQMYDTDFTQSVLEALESKVAIKAAYLGRIGNRELATL